MLPFVITKCQEHPEHNHNHQHYHRTKKKLLTVEELYVEVLYTILHMIGCDTGEVSLR